MRILVTGSRDWDDWPTISQAMGREVIAYANANGLTGPTNYVTIVHGACPTGADAMADDVARWLSWAVERHPADWERYGKRAGFVRNAAMVAAGADVCLAFIRNGSRGASMTARLAEEAGIPVKRFEYAES